MKGEKFDSSFQKENYAVFEHVDCIQLLQHNSVAGIIPIDIQIVITFSDNSSVLAAKS